jgi:hypothetical protein
MEKFKFKRAENIIGPPQTSSAYKAGKGATVPAIFGPVAQILSGRLV